MPQLSHAVTDEDHTQGPSAAPLTLVEYGDYQCPSCGEAHSVVKAVQKALGDRLRFVFRNFPLTTIHSHAQHAAEAAETAGALGQFWEVHDTLYEHQTALADGNLMDYAAELGLNTQAFQLSMTQHAQADRVKQDFLGGVRSGVNGTPTFFINAERYDGSWDLEELQAALEQAAE
jgi:protein-disulfide isomerase